jgi:CRP/FNR family transcriptional regulator, cyclic AMP receptor protein
MPPEVKQKIDDFFKNYPERVYKNGSMLIFAGEPPSGIFYIIEGQVRQYDITVGGDEVIVNVFKPPAFFPMSYAVNHTPNEYFFSAATNVKVRVAPAEDTLQFVNNNAAVMFNLLSRILRGSEGLLRRQALLMGGTAVSRLLFEIYLSCQRYGQKRKNGSCFIELKETELAARAGLTRETVNRQIKKLKEQSLIQVKSNGLIITNVDALTGMIGERL